MTNQLHSRSRSLMWLVVAGLCSAAGAEPFSSSIGVPATGQTPGQPGAVQPIAAPRVPLPPEAESAGVTKFSFLAYGDTRGSRDGVELQAEHGMVVSGMLAAIKRLAATPYPVKFVLQSGDAVASGRDAAPWNGPMAARSWKRPHRRFAICICRCSTSTGSGSYSRGTTTSSSTG